MYVMWTHRLMLVHQVPNEFSLLESEEPAIPADSQDANESVTTDRQQMFRRTASQARKVLKRTKCLERACTVVGLSRNTFLVALCEDQLYFLTADSIALAALLRSSGTITG